MSEPIDTPSAFPADILAAFPAEDLLAGLFATSVSALVLYTPARAAAGGPIIDFRLELLSEAAQHILGLPARPNRTHLEIAPGTADNGVFDFLREVFEQRAPGHRAFNYQVDGFDAYYCLAARRVADGLLASFTDTTHEPRTPVEIALRESQAREQAARAAAERERVNLRAMLDQAPVAIAVFEGPDLRIAVANERMGALWGRPLASLLSQPLLEALPELRGQGFDGQLAEVLATGVPYIGTEVPASLVRNSRIGTCYFNFVFQPFYDEQGQVRGLLDVAAEVIEQVLARQQLEAKEHHANALNEELATANEELAAANEELQAANEEVRANNDTLFHA